MDANKTIDPFLNESFISSNTSDSSILLSTISEYDEMFGDNQDYDDLYEEDTTTFSNTTLASVDEPLIFDWSLFYTGIYDQRL